MKQVLLLVGLFMSISLFSCDDDDDDKIVDSSELPVSARQFLTEHFAEVGIVSVQKDKDSYDVRLKNGFKVDFDLYGEWDEIDGFQQTVPSSIVELLPKAVSPYIMQNHTGFKVIKINRENYGYEITISNTNSDLRDLELKFDKEGIFIGIDD